MAKVEDLKTGDVVEYNGLVRRVYGIAPYHDDRFLLISWGEGFMSSHASKSLYVDLLEEFEYVDD